MNRNDKNFNYKDFRNSIHSSFKRCIFFGTLFKKSKLEYCSFSGAVFTGITFTNCNFKGSRFLGAIFENCIFQKCNFKETKFINTYIKNSSFKESSGLCLDLVKYDINELNTIDDKIMNNLKEKYKNTNVEFLVNKIDISRLLAVFELDRLENVLDGLKENEKIKIVTFSHVLSKIR